MKIITCGAPILLDGSKTIIELNNDNASDG